MFSETHSHLLAIFLTLVGVIRNKPPRLEDAIAFLGNEANHTTLNVRMKELRQNLFKGSVLPGTAANKLLKDDSTALPHAIPNRFLDELLDPEAFVPFGGQLLYLTWGPLVQVLNRTLWPTRRRKQHSAGAQLIDLT